ncbi:putative transferase CAF17 homolog, mitochondrial [Anabrus simplex]|uniref:putative transferase CAF17 homolog, mitochondrial n=1 Tax=Anabrus simplex TaxID=316456 RepID=UPI0035A3065C
MEMMFRKFLRPVKTFRIRGISRTLSFSGNCLNDTTYVEQLHKRGLLRVSGKETSVFLQGVITNDIRHLQEGALSMYTMFLNTKGRVLYDGIIYRTSDPDIVFVESDSEALPALQKHLKLYRVRRKIDIDIIDDMFKVWVVFDREKSQYLEKDIHDPTLLKGQIVSHGGTMPDKELEVGNSVIKALNNKDSYIVTRDPRLPALGHRILAPVGEDVRKDVGLLKSDECTTFNYKVVRYMLGVGEGVDDLPPGKCFPLEANCDYLHGVSFHKGCYIGQELTARTHHTGVVRKRLMPLFFDSEPSVEFKPDTPIYATPETKNAVGKLRGVEKNVGLGLLRITEALQTSVMRVMDVLVRTKRPNWWPQEAPKERSIVIKEL